MKPWNEIHYIDEFPISLPDQTEGLVYMVNEQSGEYSFDWLDISHSDINQKSAEIYGKTRLAQAAFSGHVSVMHNDARITLSFNPEQN